jgi:hypothetical protein
MDDTPARPPSRRPDWFGLFDCFRIARDPTKVWLGFLGAAFTVLMLVLALALLLEIRQVTGGETSRRALENFREGDWSAAWQELENGWRMTRADLRFDLRDIRESLWTGQLMPALQRARTVRKVVPWALVLLLLLWIPWAYFGGALSRAAAVEYAMGERVSAAEAREYAAARYGAYLWPPVALGLAIGACLAGGALAGLAAAHVLSAAVVVLGGFASLYLLAWLKHSGRPAAAAFGGGAAGLMVTALAAWWLWDSQCTWMGSWGLWLGRMVAVLLFPVALALAVPAVFLGLVLMFGRGLMISSVSFEGGDTFDSVSRAGDYLLKRPWHAGFYALVSAAYGAPCLGFVALVVLGSFLLAAVVMWAGFGEPFGEMYHAVLGGGTYETVLEIVPGFLLRILFVLACGLVVGWGASFVQACRAVAYALLRKRVDLADRSEIYIDLDRVSPTEPEPAEDRAEGDEASQPAP